MTEALVILNKNNVKHKNKDITFDILMHEFSPALLELYLTSVQNVNKSESQYIYAACGAAFGGLPTGEKSFSNFIHLTSNEPPEWNKLPKDIVMILRNRKSRFSKWYDNGWSGEDDTPENNVMIYKWCLNCFEDVNAFLTPKMLLGIYNLVDNDNKKLIEEILHG